MGAFSSAIQVNSLGFVKVIHLGLLVADGYFAKVAATDNAIGVGLDISVAVRLTKMTLAQTQWVGKEILGFLYLALT